jgi:hypothetical protein
VRDLADLVVLRALVGRVDGAEHDLDTGRDLTLDALHPRNLVRLARAA